MLTEKEPGAEELPVKYKVPEDPSAYTIAIGDIPGRHCFHGPQPDMGVEASRGPWHRRYGGLS